MDWAWWYHPPLSSAEGANGLELYLRLPSANAKACHGSTFTFTYNLKTNVDISKERQISAFEISDSAFEMLNTLACGSVLIIAVIRVLWDVMVCTEITAASVL